ncbi:hypothetical protein B5S32_g5837 [[Candida] boidinii]|nr:hypothetical protein B5S32_g5837 [[Candida] boidinii]
MWAELDYHTTTDQPGALYDQPDTLTELKTSRLKSTPKGKSLRPKGTVKDTPSVITAKQAAVRKKLLTKTLQDNTASDVVDSSINPTTDSTEIPSNLSTVNHSDSAINTTDSQVKSDHHQFSEGLLPDSCNSQPEDSGKPVIFTPQKGDDSTNIGPITTDSTISDHPESALTHTTPGERIIPTPTVTPRRPPHPSAHPELSLLSKQKPSWLTKNLSSLNSKGRPRRRPDDYHTSPGSQLSSYTPLYNKNSKRNTFSNHLGLHHVLGPTLPRNYSQALHSSESGNWKAAIQEELDSHSSLYTWDPHPIITNDKKLLSKTVSTQWVFAKKSDGRYKARLVARGDHQKPHTYQDTYSPTLRPELARSILARCAQDHWYFAQFDIKTAYLNASIDTEIYLAAPQGTPPVDAPKGSKVIYRLQRALYGLKQSGRLWHDTISLHLRSLNFTTQPSVFPSVFYRSDATIGLFVDDIIVTAKSHNTLQKISKHLSDVYELKELLPDETGYQRFLGMNLFVQRNTKDQVEAISLNQSSYIHQVVQDMNIAIDSKPNTPLPPNFYYDPAQHPFQASETVLKQKMRQYRELVGTLLYLSLMTRLDITYAVNYLARFTTTPHPLLYANLIRILQYLYHTADYTLTYKRDESHLQVYTDSDYASDPIHRRSMTGYLIMFASAPIQWRSHYTDLTCQSSTEAELQALVLANNDVIWHQTFMVTISAIASTAIPHFFVDNRSAIDTIVNGNFSARSKHYAVRLHTIYDHFRNHGYHISHVPTTLEFADILTKPITVKTHRNIIPYLLKDPLQLTC